MTTPAQLGRMLIEVEENGRTLQSEHRGAEDGYADHNRRLFDLEKYRFKLVPRITYYRVYLDSLEQPQVDYSTCPFPAENEWDRDKVLKDFQVEEI